MRFFVRFLACLTAGAAAMGCGRIGFDGEVAARSGDASGGDGGGSVRACGDGDAAPDPLSIDGVTFQFLDFANTRGVVDTATVAAVAVPGGAVLASTTSDGAGNYHLEIATGGVAPAIALRFTKIGWFTSTRYFDAPLDHALAVGNQVDLAESDGPMWNTGSMGSVYGTVGFAPDSARSTINVQTVTCAGAPLAGVAVDVSPAPQRAAYLGSNGMPDGALVATAAPLAFLVAYNAVAAETTVTAASDTARFPTQRVPVPAGDEVTLVRVRPLP